MKSRIQDSGVRSQNEDFVATQVTPRGAESALRTATESLAWTHIEKPDLVFSMNYRRKVQIWVVSQFECRAASPGGRAGRPRPGQAPALHPILGDYPNMAQLAVLNLTIFHYFCYR